MALSWGPSHLPLFLSLLVSNFPVLTKPLVEALLGAQYSMTLKTQIVSNSILLE